MAESVIHSRDKTDLYNFENLMSQGIGLLQDLSGEVWTDYNLHDPGITLLEQLCFALTDVVYRSDLDAVQYLANENGQIDLSNQGLYAASKVLSSGPVKADDFESLFLDKIQDLNMIILDFESSHYGDFQFSSGGSIGKVKQEIVELFHANRPLCHNIARSFKKIECEEVSLLGMIEINNGFQAEEILADILLYAEKFISPPPRFIGYDEFLQQGCDMEDVLQGPFTAKGRLSIDRENNLLASKLSQELMQIKGIKRVSKLEFLIGSNNNDEQNIKTLLEVDSEHFFCLLFSENEQIQNITLTQNGKAQRINIKQFIDNVNRKRMRKNSKDFSMLVHNDIFPTIEQEYWALDEIYPIYQQLPTIYSGAGNHELTANDKKQRVNNKQLNAYLMLFEQFIANNFASLNKIKELFSLDEDLDRSYFNRPLEHPQSKRLYRYGNVHEQQKMLDEIIAENDDFDDRRNRVLDYLLALYAETYPDDDFFKLDNSASKRSIKRDLIRAKIALLKHIPRVGYSRLLAQDISKPLAWHFKPEFAMNMSGLQLRSSLLLGLWDITQRSLMSVYEKLSLKLIADYKYEELNVNLKVQLSDSYVSANFNNSPDNIELIELNIQQLTSTYNNLKTLGVFTESVLTLNHIEQGMQLDNYAVVFNEKKSAFLLVFKIANNQWIKLSEFGKEYSALRAVELCWQFFNNIHIKDLMFNESFMKDLNLSILPEEKIEYQPLFLEDVYDKSDAVDKHIRERFRPAVLEEKSDYITFEEVEKLLAELQSYGLFNRGLDLALLKSGTDTNRYRIGYSGKSNTVVLAFRFGEDNWVKLATFDDVGIARAVASHCQQFLYAINRFGEGMHIIEDGFLSRVNSHDKELSKNSSENYQVRVILPQWVVRFESRDFQAFVETLLQQSCPAHIYCNFYWLSYEDVNTFERSYENWHRQYLKSMSSAKSSLDINVELDNAQAALTSFFTNMDNKEHQRLEILKGKYL